MRFGARSGRCPDASQRLGETLLNSLGLIVRGVLVASLVGVPLAARAGEPELDLRWRGVALGDLPGSEALTLEGAVRLTNPAGLDAIESVAWLERAVVPIDDGPARATAGSLAPRHLLQVVGRAARFATPDEPGTRERPPLGVVVLEARLAADASDMPTFKVVRESPMAALDVTIDASLSDRLVVVADELFGFIRVYPAGVGAIDRVRAPGRVASLTPTTELGRLSRDSSRLSLRVPSWARGKPYLPFEIPWVGKEKRWYVETRVAFHIWQERTFSRGFNSYGCITLRDQDLDELASVVFAHARPLPLRVQAAAYAQHRHPFPYEDDHYWQLDNLGTAARPVITRGAYYAIEKVDEAPPEVADMVDIFMVAERHRPTLGLLGPVAQARSVPGALMP